MTSNDDESKENSKNDEGVVEPDNDIIENIKDAILNVVPHIDDSIQRREYSLETVARDIMITQKEKKDKERKDRKRLYGIDNEAVEIIHSLHNQWRPKISREFIITAAKRKGYSLLSYVSSDAILYIDECKRKIYTNDPLAQCDRSFIAGGSSKKTEHYWADDETEASYGSISGDLDIKLIDNLFITFAILGDATLPDSMKEWSKLIANKFKKYMTYKINILSGIVSGIEVENNTKYDEN